MVRAWIAASVMGATGGRMATATARPTMALAAAAEAAATGAGRARTAVGSGSRVSGWAVASAPASAAGSPWVTGVGAGVASAPESGARASRRRSAGRRRGQRRPVQSCCRNARAFQVRDPVLNAVAVTVNRTQPRNSRRSPPLSVCTVTRFPAIESTCQVSPEFEPVTTAAETSKLPGTSTTTHPISLLLASAARGSSFVAVSVNTRWTPTVAVNGVAVRLQRMLAARAPEAEASESRAGPPAPRRRPGPARIGPSCDPELRPP